MNSIILLLLGAILAEALVEAVKPLMDREQFNWQYAVALLFGLVVAVSTGLDLFALVGFQIQVPFLGSILTGILFGRGSNYVHDVLIRLQSAGKNQDPSPSQS